VPDEDDVAQVEGLEDVEHVTGVAVQRVVTGLVVRRRVRAPGADVVEQNHAVVLEQGHDVAPHPLVAAEAVREDQRSSGRVAGLHDVVAPHDVACCHGAGRHVPLLVLDPVEAPPGQHARGQRPVQGPPSEVIGRTGRGFIPRTGHTDGRRQGLSRGEGGGSAPPTAGSRHGQSRHERGPLGQSGSRECRLQRSRRRAHEAQARLMAQPCAESNHVGAPAQPEFRAGRSSRAPGRGSCWCAAIRTPASSPTGRCSTP
jgi:hypothetical protein